MTNKEYQIFPAASAPAVDIEIHFLLNFKENKKGIQFPFFSINYKDFISSYCALLSILSSVIDKVTTQAQHQLGVLLE